MIKILYLDDEETLTEFLPQVLKDKGIEMISTGSIEVALEKFAKENFDAVLLDIMMEPAENMDAEKLDYGLKTGTEVARRMQEINPKIPIVAFTVMTDEKIMEDILKAGVIRIATKPIELEQLARVLTQFAKK